LVVRSRFDPSRRVARAGAGAGADADDACQPGSSKIGDRFPRASRPFRAGAKREGGAMRAFGLACLVVTSMVVPAARSAFAVTADERCEAYQLAASGQRISAKLHCRAWAKLTGTPVDASCLDKAEKRFLLQLQEGGPGCAAPDDVVSLGAAADAQINQIVSDVQIDPPTLPSLGGRWRTRTTVGFATEVVLDCDYYKPKPCPDPGAFLLIECDTQIVQSGATLTYASTCGSAPDSPATIPTFTQAATGTIDVVTGEWTLAGTVEVPGLGDYGYAGEGVFSADGRGLTGFTTAGWGAGATFVQYLATTSGSRVD
jgi:hypothetical protein